MNLICKNKDLDLFYKYLDLMNDLFIDVNPIMIKEALNYLGFNVGNVRLPLYNTSKEKLEQLVKTIDKAI